MHFAEDRLVDRNGHRRAVAIVGSGPRGAVVLERLCANAPELLADAADGELDIHVVDPFPASRVWRPDQPDVLLMNSRAQQATLFTDDSVRCAGPINPGPDLHTWASTIGPHYLGDSELRTEAAELAADNFPSRALFAHYLDWYLHHVTQHAPAGVRIIRHRATAVSLAETDDGSQRLVLREAMPSQANIALVVDAVVLAVGHAPLRPDDREVALSRFAADHRLAYFPPGAANEADWDGLGPGDEVAVLGTGLNFYDCQALLTEARGGKFLRDSSGALHYEPSGREPVLFVGSARGIPYHARSVAPAGFTPVFLDSAAMSELCARPADVDFDREIWPLMAKDMRWAYYLCAHREHGHEAATPLPRLLRAYRELPSEGGDVDALFAAAFPTIEPFDLPAMLDPWSRQGTHSVHTDATAVDKAVADLVRADLDAARQRPRNCLKAAEEALAVLKDRLRDIVAAGGLNGVSYRRDVDGWFRSAGAFLAAGPPAIRVEQLLALHQAGLVVFLGPDSRVRANPSAGRFMVSSAGLIEREFTALIDARLHGVDLTRTADPLLADLVAGGMARAYQIPAADSALPTGGLDVDPVDFRLRDAAGVASPRRFAYGIPIEPIHWNIANLPQPGRDAATMRQADIIARTALRATASNTDRTGEGQ